MLNFSGIFTSPYVFYCKRQGSFSYPRFFSLPVVIDKLMADYQLDPLAPKQPAPDKAASAEAESIASAAINKTTAAKTTGMPTPLATQLRPLDRPMKKSAWYKRSIRSDRGSLTVKSSTP